MINDFHGFYHHRHHLEIVYFFFQTPIFSKIKLSYRNPLRLFIVLGLLKSHTFELIKALKHEHLLAVAHI